MMLHMDGFDSYSTATDLNQEYSYAQDTYTNVDTTGGRYGQGSVFAFNYDSFLQRNFSQLLTEVWTGFAFKPNGASSDGIVCGFQSPAGSEATFRHTVATGAWSFWVGNTQVASATRPLVVGEWYWVELHYLMDPAAGVAEVWVNNGPVLQLSGTSTSRYGGTQFNNVSITGDPTSNVNYGDAYYDDWYVLDTTGSHNNARLGDGRIETLLPVSDAGPNDGTPSVAGDHYLMVNAATTNDGATYVTLANASGQEELYGCETLDWTPPVCHALRVIVNAIKTDGGSCQLSSAIVSSGVPAYGSGNQLLTTSYHHSTDIHEVDPATGEPWTFQAVNVASFGFRVP